MRPLGDRVLVREITKGEEEKTASGFILPTSEDKNSDFKKGVVVAVGPGKYDDGVLVPVGVKKGDKVLFSWGDKVKIDGEELSLVKESEISAIFS
ncbi:MAG: co-chaperone GroES [Patescibacteria group bacterium]